MQLIDEHRTKFRDKSDFMTAHTKTIPADSRIPSLNRALRLVGYHLPDQTFLQGFLVIAVPTIAAAFSSTTASTTRPSASSRCAARR
mgnify:CR=1 FL=1